MRGMDVFIIVALVAIVLLLLSVMGLRIQITWM